MDIEEITYKINGAVFEVNKELGAGFFENDSFINISSVLVRVCPWQKNEKKTI